MSAERTLPDRFADKIAERVVYPALLYEGVFVNSSGVDQTVRLWTGVGTLTWDGKTWTGGGELLGISPLEESSDLSALGFSVQLSGQPSANASLALNSVQQSQGRSGKVWLALFEQLVYLDLPGTSGNYASTPDSAALTIAADLDLVVQCSSDDWTPAASTTVFSRWTSTQSWALQLGTDGKWRFFWFDADGVQHSVTASVANGLVDGAKTFFNVTLDIDDGAGGHAVTFYTSDDGIDWTQLGTTLSAGAFTTSLRDSNGPLTVSGVGNGASQAWAGKVYYAEVRNGIDGEIVASFDPARVNGLSGTMRTGEVWTVNQSGADAARIVSPGPQLIDVLLLKRGRLDTASIKDSGDEARIVVNYEDRLIDLQRPRERKYTDEDQKIDYPDDRGFEFVSELQTAPPLQWGKK